MNTIIYPWQNELWERLANARQRLPHALLLRGRHGTGKFGFSLQLTRSLLCERPGADGHACGICASCGWFDQNNHPDYRLLTPEQEGGNGEDENPTVSPKSKKTQISVTQIRELASFLGLSSHRGGGLRIALIHPAETLNAASANALLKMLEEPPADAVFILVSHQPHRLLPTIVSRCQKIDMPVPDTDSALQWLSERGMRDADSWLQYAGGSPLTVLTDMEEGAKQPDKLWQALSMGARLDPFVTAPLCMAQGMEAAINALQKWVYDLISCHLTQQVRYHAQQTSALQALIKSVDFGLLLDFQHKLDEARKSATHPLNNELQLENLLLQYTQMFSTQI
ncbi:MAG TPA: DNA polymerase III subunit delta' [Methylophilaceae bacterium]|nr:DNA polymerase III subunit delta' [Methylophilaceae bacterium]